MTQTVLTISQAGGAAKHALACAALGTALSLGLLRPVFAQADTSAPIRLILPTTPGSLLDAIARLLVQQMNTRSGRNIILDSRPGAGTTIGARLVAKSAPDGRTLLFTSNSHYVSAALYRNLDYDAIRDFSPIGRVAKGTWILLVSPKVPAVSVSELVAYAKANPQKLSIGYGVGTAPHLLAELFKQSTGASILNVPYKGASQAVTDILGGQIHLVFTGTAGVMPLIQRGQLRVLAATGATRDPLLPDIPTMAESGVPQLTLSFWLGVFAPAGVPSSIIARLSEDMNASLANPESQAALEKLGVDWVRESPADFAKAIPGEAQTWKRVADSSNLKID